MFDSMYLFFNSNKLSQRISSKASLTKFGFGASPILSALGNNETVNESSREKKTCWEELPPCRQIWEYIKMGCCIIFLSYVIGALSVADYIRYGYSKWKPEHHILALAIGLCEFCIVSYCCWRSLCYPRTDRY